MCVTLGPVSIGCSLVVCALVPLWQWTFVLLSGYNICIQSLSKTKGSLSVWLVTREQGHTSQGNSLWIQGLAETKGAQQRMTYCFTTSHTANHFSNMKPIYFQVLPEADGVCDDPIILANLFWLFQIVVPNPSRRIYTPQIYNLHQQFDPLFSSTDKLFMFDTN